MTDDEGEGEGEDGATSTTEPEAESFWLEDSTLQYFFVGMKLEVTVSELSIGIKFFDRVMGIYCSFYTALPNEKVIEFWKEPGKQKILRHS
jgi:hypothetical protein